MVAAVIGHPGDDGALEGDRARHREPDPERPVGLERAMGEVAVVPGGDAQRADEVERDGQGDVGDA